MKGHNDLVLNQATIMEIFQEWLDRHTKLYVDVIGVSFEKEGMSRVCRIRLSDRPKVDEDE